MDQKKCDAIIVGAGPAGCAAAFFLANSGFDVLIVDKTQFPRDKICGDGISAPALDILEEMGALGKIEEKNPLKISRVMISSPNGRMMTGEYPAINNYRNYGHVVKRKELDFILFEQTKALPSVQTMENFRVNGLIHGNAKVIGVKGLQGDVEMEILADYIIGADGVHSKIAREIGLFNDKKGHRGFAVRAYYEHMRDLSEAVEIHYDSAVAPGYCWIFPTSETSANVGVGLFTRYGDPKAVKDLFHLFINHNQFAKRKLKNAERRGPLKGFPLTLGSFGASRSKKNVLLTGDAASFIDPMTGEGIYYALLSGKMAAEAIKKGGAAGRAGEMYEKMWKGKFKYKEFLPGYLLQTFMKSKHVLNFAVAIGSRSPRIANRAAAVIGHLLPKHRILF